MSNRINLFDNDYVRANITPADLNLYVVTKDKLTNISSSSMWNDILIFLASLTWGAYFSTTIALQTSKGISIENLSIITAYQNIFFWTGIVFIVLFLLIKAYLYIQIFSITKSTLEIQEGE